MIVLKICAPKLDSATWPDCAVLVTEQRMQPAVRLAAVAKIVDQLGMSHRHVIDIQRHVVIARQTAEEALRHLAPVHVEHIQPQRQRLLCDTAIGVGCTMLRNVSRGSTGNGSRYRAPAASANLGIAGSGFKSARSTFTCAMRVRSPRVTS